MEEAEGEDMSTDPVGVDVADRRPGRMPPNELSSQPSGPTVSPVLPAELAKASEPANSMNGELARERMNSMSTASRLLSRPSSKPSELPPAAIAQASSRSAEFEDEDWDVP